MKIKRINIVCILVDSWMCLFYIALVCLALYLLA
jgi:hypothetical protein